MRLRSLRQPLAALLLLTPAGTSSAEWPGWMGPNRDNRPSDLKLPADFTAKAPEVVWKTPTAGGYSGPAVAGGRVYLTDYESNQDSTVANFERAKLTGRERVRCLDASTGKELWSHAYPVSYSISYPAGPRCTPIVDGDTVITLGAEGQLICFQTQDGSIVWSKDLPKEYSTKVALWGYASHPLIDGDKLICVVGGTGSHVVAFNKRTGEEIWRQGTASEQGYVPPTIINAGGTRQLITAGADAVNCLDPETGKVYWTTPYEATNGSIIMSPVTTTIDGKTYLYIGGYSNKNLLLELADDKPAMTVVWQDENRHAISPVNVQPILDGNMLYGFDQKGTLMGVELPSGDRLWETGQPIAERPIQSATAFIMAPKGDDRYLMFTELGDLVIAEMTADGYNEIDRAHVIEPTGVAFGRRVVWSAPAVDDGKLFIRNDKEIVCVDVSDR
ncbi:PQQ-binding-like beta-propeller repeat protein [Rhodopirellula sp. MGV]|uniref:PQQ-binding-like beta-propeller repeat protein n=1 Tax=Rhodopirellula sp. MGV TaxID=2023130 RepID=UPI000B968572|nr:PQQ-binding-like beta-propeller repeat protein [Rhodopirellula sp. MGV]OYP36402.1 pyrrolo-quinoline quinone [Rhodopirellula sp. MGV]PNY36829.1 pyrrolo-quinoline quinone [Rhodopirellula baltica]